MFDLSHDDSFELDPMLIGLDGGAAASPTSSSSDPTMMMVGSPSSSSVASSPGGGCGGDGGGKVFGSFLVDRNSSTPYTDATQVR